MIEFIKAYPELVALLVLYVLMNIAPRPHPDDHAGWRWVLWTLLDRLAVLTAGTMPGRLKWVFLQTVRPAEPLEQPLERGKDD